MKTILSHPIARLFYTFPLILFFLNSCTYSGANVEKGDGNVVSNSHQVGFFNSIELYGAYQVTLTQGEQASVVVETDNNLQELVTVSVDNETLHVSSQRDKALRPTRMDLLIVYPALEKLAVSGASKISATGPLVMERLHLDMSGATDLQFDLHVQTLITQVAGAGNIHFGGTALEHRIDLSGASNLSAEDLITESTTITLSGAGSANIHASQAMTAKLSGIGRITYHGHPPTTNIQKSGLGSIRPAN